MKIQWANHALPSKLPALPPVEARESSTHLSEPRARQGGRKKATLKSRANARHARLLFVRSRKPGACSRVKTPSQTQALCFILKAFVKAGAPSCTVGYPKLCSVERGRVTKSGIEADLGGGCVHPIHQRAGMAEGGDPPVHSALPSPLRARWNSCSASPRYSTPPHLGVIN